jgi:hypothetical protein
MNKNDWTAPEIEYIRNRSLFKAYLKDHPMPTNNVYASLEELTDSLFRSTGILTLPENADACIVEYLETLLEHMQ